MTHRVRHFGGARPATWLRMALAYPRVTLNLRPSVARANLFSGD
jgi:hypothetical protein